MSLAARAGLLLTALAAVGCGPGAQGAVDAGARWDAVACLHDAGCPQFLYAAHRAHCDGTTEPENTVAAIRHCAGVGAPMVEIDTRPSKDGVIVLHHDSELSRMTDVEAKFPGKDKVSDLTLAELKTLLLDTDPRCTGGQPDPERCRVATLDEALRATDALTYFIDFKAGSAEATAQVIAAAGATPRALFFDSNLANLEAARRAAPGLSVMPRIYSKAEVDTLLATTTLPLEWIHGNPELAAELEPVLAPRGIRLYANIWHLDAELYAAQGLPAAEEQRVLDRSVVPQLKRLVAQGLDGGGTEFAKRLLGRER